MSRPPAYARRTDDNHAEIRDALRQIPGVYCQDVSAASGLGFDLLCNFRGGPPPDETPAPYPGPAFLPFVAEESYP